MEREDSAHLIGWLIAGAALGVAAALLLAPGSGTQTRQKLKAQAGCGGKAVLDSAREIFERGRDWYERGREIAEEVADTFERSRRIAEKTFNEKV